MSSLIRSNTIQYDVFICIYSQFNVPHCTKNEKDNGRNKTQKKTENLRSTGSSRKSVYSVLIKENGVYGGNDLWK